MKTITKLGKAQRRFAYKLWSGRSPDEILTKRFKLFVLIGIIVIAISKLLYLQGIMPFPNFELIIPTLVVIGSFSLYLGSSKAWRGINRYFGIVALISVFAIDVAFWGFRSIYLFTWPGLAFAWVFAMKNKLSMFNNPRKLLMRTMLTAATAIIIFDAFTGLLGHTLTTGASFQAAFVGQIPFTIYHLASLSIVPPLVMLAKMMVKVKVPVGVVASARVQVKSQESW